MVLRRPLAVAVACAVVVGGASAAQASDAAPAGLCPSAQEVCALVVEVDPGAVGEVLDDVRDADASAAEPVGPDALGVRADGADAAAVLQALRRAPGVREVRVDPVLELAALPSDTYLPQQREYLDPVRLPALWETGRADGQLVAVVDSGVDDTHPELAGRVVDRFDATTGAASAVDLDGHGTMVASVAAASTDNGLGIAGSGWGAHLLAAKVEDVNGDIYASAVASAVRWSTEQGADVINISLGGPVGDPLLRAAVEDAHAAGVLVVASAGNDGTTSLNYPAAYPTVLAVGSTTRDGAARSHFSQYGAWVDVAAPGEELVAAYPGGGYVLADGTSFSSPLVAGAAAVLRAGRPDATPAQVAAALTTTARATPAGFGSGLVDVASAADALVPGGACLPPHAAVSGALRADGTTARAWRDAATGGVRVQLVGADGVRGPVENAGGALLGIPSVAWRGDGSLEIAGRGTNGILYLRNRAAAGTYGPWTNFGARLTARPELTSRPDGGVDVLLRGGDGALHLHASTRVGAYGARVGVGGALLAGSGPAASYDSAGRLVVAVVGTDRSLWVRARTGSAWTPWRKGGGVLTGDVDAAAPGGAVQVAGLGTNASVYALGVRVDATATAWTRVTGPDVGELAGAGRPRRPGLPARHHPRGPGAQRGLGRADLLGLGAALLIGPHGGR